MAKDKNIKKETVKKTPAVKETENTKSVEKKEKKVSQVMKCTCISKYQDEKYGKGNRFHNYGRKINTNGGYRCTVCGNTK